jgi:hypothetical protein
LLDLNYNQRIIPISEQPPPESEILKSAMVQFLALGHLRTVCRFGRLTRRDKIYGFD